MKIIEKVEVYYYRSFMRAQASGFKELNVFSGRNDSGKSNVIRALDLFFNTDNCTFKDDYNKERATGAKKLKEKHVISVAVTFRCPKGYKILPPHFRVIRSWDKSGKLITQRDNIESMYKRHKMNLKKLGVAGSRLTMFLNKVAFVYVPPVRDERYFTKLLLLLQEELFAAENRKTSTSDIKGLEGCAQNFNQEIGRLTDKLTEDFQLVSGIKTTPTLPTNLEDLFKAIQVDTDQGKYEVPLSLRGHGIQMRYIPAILNHISTISTKYYVWGFDEPENSCEYYLCSQLANDFADAYTKNAQIFVISHSFAFISLNSKKVARFRVLKNSITNYSEVYPVIDGDKRLEVDLGIIKMNERLSEIHNEYEMQLSLIQKISSDYEEHKKPFLLFEGPTDNDHFAQAYNALYQKSIHDIFRLDSHDCNADGATISSSASHLNHFLSRFVGKIQDDAIVIGVFDYDTEGYTQYKGLDKNIYVDATKKFGGNLVLRNKNHDNVFALVIVPPTHRSGFVNEKNPNYCYLTTELLYQDDIIPKGNKLPPSPNEKILYEFTGKKRGFVKHVQKVGENKTVDYSGFKPTFTVIESIIKDAKKKKDTNKTAAAEES